MPVGRLPSYAPNVTLPAGQASVMVIRRDAPLVTGASTRTARMKRASGAGSDSVSVTRSRVQPDGASVLGCADPPLH